MSEALSRADLAHRLPYELAPSPDWRSGQFLVFDAVNDGPYMADVECRFADDAAEVRINLGLFPGLPTRVALPLQYLDAQQVIPGRTPHRFKCVCAGDPVDVGRLRSVSLVGRTVGGHADLRISEPYVADRMPTEWPRAQRPIVDELHQRADRDWPGKSEGLEAIGARVTEELLATEIEPEAALSRWGGWADLRFEPTGFFRTEHDGRRWWLVDPEGYAFYSVGVDCVRPSVCVETDGNEDLFAELPPKDGEYKDCWREGRDGRRTIFDALRYNLKRAFGDAWFDRWLELCGRRLSNWGFNTVGNWSDLRFCRLGGLPYVLPMSGFPTTQARIFRDFPDVFSDEYVANSRTFAGQLEGLRRDQYMIGYFLRNEPHWAFGEHSLAEQMLLQEGRLASRDRLVEWLKERYGELSALNARWGGDVASFEALASRRLAPRQWASEAAQADLREFNRVLIERYVRVPSEECKRVDPDHLNLGVRYAWIAYEDLLAGADAFDVFSLNAYGDRPPADVVARCSAAAGAPVLIGEFHTGALDRGLPMGGLRVVPTQQDRGNSYHYYVEQGAAIPELVGTHYFQWNDQHVAGRFDGENWQIGIVDICQREYDAFVAAARRSHARIYRVASGQMKPSERLPAGLSFE